MPASSIDSLLGGRLLVVEFTAGYFNLVFEGGTVSLLNPAVITTGDDAVPHTSLTFAGLVVRSLGAVLESAEVIPDVAIHLHLSSHVDIAVSLRPDDYWGPEAAILILDDQVARVWR